MENINVRVTESPFPHAIFNNFYNETELSLIWEELNFYTKPNKLLGVKDYEGVIGATNAKAIILDSVYENHRSISNILTVNRKIFHKDTLEVFSNISDSCGIARYCNWDCTKLRYYHNGEYYRPHIDKTMQFLAFSYFYKEPKKFTGGELLFPKYDYKMDCDNNSLIMFPGWVEHGVNEVSIQNSDYYEGYGRYAITSFFGCKDKKKSN
tara:strand:- start:761 stop:1387 length:627 start_codon:yes stop_codon:yes gene_type:complete